MAVRKVNRTRKNRRRSRSRKIKGGACPSGQTTCDNCKGTGKAILRYYKKDGVDTPIHGVCPWCKGKGCVGSGPH
jgi:hypothetical protein